MSWLIAAPGYLDPVPLGRGYQAGARSKVSGESMQEIRPSGRSVGWAHGVLVAPKGFRRTFVIEYQLQTPVDAEF